MNARSLDRTDTAAPSVTIESLANELRQAFPGGRNVSVSIHAQNGDPLWMSDGVLGPDEHSFVAEAIKVFEVEGHRAFVTEELTANRGAVFFAACLPTGELVGVAMVLADPRTIDRLSASGSLITPK
ncbi:MAG: hypothetical protein NZM12_11040, partial [Steroidobacteraceae bacterium]|nr:hypothetical protein [Steroidobacteraceae bacterium]MDW8260272.1 hypothetical protein [Gammaproteobacteria bacterium]